MPPARPPLRQRLSRMLAHHPDLPRYRADVYRIAGVRVCVGCATAFPAFYAATLWLAFAGGPPWAAALAGGLGLAAPQAVSSAGWARWKWLKAMVKAALGVGLALATHGVLSAPWPQAAQAAALLGFLALAGLSTVPRSRRMAAA